MLSEFLGGTHLHVEAMIQAKVKAHSLGTFQLKQLYQSFCFSASHVKVNNLCMDKPLYCTGISLTFCPL